MRRTAVLVIACLAAWLGAAAAQAPSPAGVWTTFDDDTGKPAASVRIDEANGEFRGTVIAVLSGTDPNPVCEKCAGEFRGRPIVGLTILRGLRRAGSGFAGGRIIDPDDGGDYQCEARLIDGGRRLELRGYLGVPLFGRAQVWERER